MLAKRVAVEVEQRDEERNDADRVDHDEDGREDHVGLVALRVAVDGEAVRTDANLRCRSHIGKGLR